MKSVTQLLMESVEVWERNSGEDNVWHRGFGRCTVNGNDKIQCMIGSPRTGRQGDSVTCLGLRSQ